MTAASPPPEHPSFATALRLWLRIGLLSFGGPAGQIALMHRELVENRRWISEQRFLHALNYCMLLPGPEAQQLATYIGWLLHGVRGGIVAGVLFVLPGFTAILLLSSIYATFHDSHWLGSSFFGLKAAVLAIVAEALLRLSRRALRSRALQVLAVAAFVAMFAFGVPFPLVILAAGLVGWLKGRRGKNPVTTPEAAAPATVLDAVPVLAPSWSRAARVLLVCAALWVLPLVVIVPVWGPHSTFAALFGFFSQMAVVTFGGAYAVLSYVASEAVTHFGWLSPGEMLDGLALAETTPGPLVLVLCFVGFMAGARAQLSLDPLVGGIVGASLTAWVTFVPCFLWIFLGAPYIEQLRRNPALSAALGAITAAVVGVILNLALWFAAQILFTAVTTWRVGPMSLLVPVWSSFDWLAAALAAIAALALFRLRWPVTPVLALSAVLGFVLKSLLPA